MQRLGALGTFVWDTIWHPSAPADEPVRQWGGMAYSLAALSAACPAGWRVEPLVRIGRDLAPAARGFLRGLPAVAQGPGLRVVDRPTNRVELRYRDGAEREEYLSGGVGGWDWAELAPLLEGLDALYVNFLSGYELDLPTARRLRANFPGPVYADLHSLFLGPPRRGPRVARTPAEWQAWLACFDAVQLNETELGLLPVAGDPAALLAHGPCLVALTRGAAGARLATVPGLSADPRHWPRTGASVRGTPRVADLPLPRPPLDGDPTGCGDVWGSVLFTGLLDGLPPRAAAVRAHRLASRKVRCTATDRLRAELAAELNLTPD